MTTPTSTDTENFDRRFAAVRYENPAAATEIFTADEVARYIAAKAERATDFSYPYEDVLRTFPRAWWLAPIAAILRARGSGDGSSCFVAALLKVDPEYFADAPHQLIGWQINTTRILRALQANREAAEAGLRRMLADPSDGLRWLAAMYLALLVPDAETLIAQALTGSSEAEQQRASWSFQSFGYQLRDGILQRLWPRASYHLVFPAEYTIDRDAGASFPGTATAPDHEFGGFIAGRNDRGERVLLHRVITLDPVPEDLGVTVPRLDLVMALLAVEDDNSATFYVHHADGTIEAQVRLFDWQGHTEHPAIRPTHVQLVRTPESLRFQRWGETTAGASLFRIGGPPVFVQSATYPKCPRCRFAMMHLMSLDSGLPLEKKYQAGEFLDWGSGGVANAFWCDGCRVSAWTWGCT